MSVLIHHLSRDPALLSSICISRQQEPVPSQSPRAAELEEGLNTRLFNKMKRALSFPTGFLLALSCCWSPRVVSGPASPWADRFPNSPPCTVSTVSATAKTSCSSWKRRRRRRKPRWQQSLASCVWVFFPPKHPQCTGDLEQGLCPSVCSRKRGLIPFPCLPQSWLRCLIHVSALAGDCGMNDAI